MDFLLILFFSFVVAVGFGFIAFLLTKAHQKEVATMKVGDIVTWDGLDAEIISMDETTFEVRVRVPKMRVSKKK